MESEIRQKIAEVLEGSLPLNDLYRWLMAHSWNMHRDSPSDAVDLASELELLFIERSNGDLLDRELVAELNRMIGPNARPASGTRTRSA